MAKLQATTINGDLTVTGTTNKIGLLTISSGTVSGVASLSASGSISAQSFTATSDRRLKQDIVDLTDLDYSKVIDSLDIKSFRFKNSPEKLHIGLIAQELRDALPEKYQECFVQEDNSEEKYLSINEDKLVYLALMKIKDQDKKIKELEEKIEYLMNRGE